MTMTMMMMMMIIDNRCSVCRGEATTSSARCQCRTPAVNAGDSSTRCVNCGVLTTSSSLCTRCSALPRCRRCKRNLPRHCFRQFNSFEGDEDDDGDDGGGGGERSHLCRACDRRRRKPTTRRSPDDIVTEISIPIADSASSSFDSFVSTHQDQIRQHVEEHRQLHRYVILLDFESGILEPVMYLLSNQSTPLT